MTFSDQFEAHQQIKDKISWVPTGSLGSLGTILRYIYRTAPIV